VWRGHFGDQFAFDIVDRLFGLHEAREQIVIAFLAFRFQDDELAAQAVCDSVLRRDGLTGRGRRTAALLSIAAVCFEFAF
jgi:hypothetical protein